LKRADYILAAIIILSLGAIFAVSWHSVEEIHYLKGFYPSEFTVSEALQAALVELIKILLIALPLIVTIAIALYLIALNRRQP